METINQYQHVRLRPGMYGLHDNYFNKIFHQCILDLLHEFSFTTLKISTVPERTEVIFDCVRKGVKPTTVTAATAMETIRVVKAEIESVRTGKAVTL